MKYCIIYWSRFGHGKKVIDYINNKLQEKNHETCVFKTDEADPSALADADVYLFSAPTEAFRIQRNMRQFMKKIEGMEGKKYGIINTHGMKGKNWLGSMEKMLSKKKMVKIAAIDFQIGEGQKNGEGLMDDWESKLNEFIGKI